MGRRRKNVPHKAVTKAQAEQMSRFQGRNAFEPDLLCEMKYRNAEDEHAEGIEPLTAEELAEQDAICENQRRLLTTALEPGGNERQMTPFTGSVVSKVIEIAREAEALGAANMEHAEWMHLHERLYNKHMPFSSQRYKLFRRAARGNLNADPELVKFLTLQRMVETGRITKEQCDKLGGAYTAIHHMYDAMRRDVEQARRAQGDDEQRSKVNGDDESKRAPPN